MTTKRGWWLCSEVFNVPFFEKPPKYLSLIEVSPLYESKPNVEKNFGAPQAGRTAVRHVSRQFLETNGRACAGGPPKPKYSCLEQITNTPQDTKT